ncbi:Omp28-related outer membrane protein [candidate division KSB1 bacterium]|nr:Omp28-related outer membrane protein [candidate division KSB1 bacterium]
MKALNCFMLIFLFILTTVLFADGQRNPVLEYATGVWCTWCPEGHAVINNEILPEIPNAIVLAYHGPPNDTGDPMSFFEGNDVIDRLGLSAYPTGIVDRVSGIVSRDEWLTRMRSRLKEDPSVDIKVVHEYDLDNGKFTALIKMTALTELNGIFRYNTVLVEDGLVFPDYPQVSGGPDYVHNHVVRAMMNGSRGDIVSQDVWIAGQKIEKTFSYTVRGEIVPDSCHIVVFVYREEYPLASNGEILQAEQLKLVVPKAKILAAGHSSAVAEKSATCQFTARLYNESVKKDTFNISLVYSGPQGWDYAFTNNNVTYANDAVATVEIESKDSTGIFVTLEPKTITGFGQVEVKYQSVNDPRVTGNVQFRVVTDSGVQLLIVQEDTKTGIDTVLSNSVQRFYPKKWGVVHRSALWKEIQDLSAFEVVLFSSGNTGPAFLPQEVDHLSAFLNNGGRLVLSGQDMARDVFEADGASRFAQDFYKDMLHIQYEGDKSKFQLLSGVSGDPIGNGLSLTLNSYYDKSPDIFAPSGPTALSVLTYMKGPEIAAIRTETEIYRVFVMGIGLEQIRKQADRDTLLARAVRWLTYVPPGVGESFTMFVDSTRFTGHPGRLFDRYAEIQNTSEKSLKLRVIRSRNQLPEGWFSALCVGELCFPFTLDTIDVFEFNGDLPPDEKLDFHLQVGSHVSQAGNGIVAVKIQDVDNPADTVTVTFYFSTEPSSVDKHPVVGPTRFGLEQNYPNPFNAFTKIRYTVPEGEQYNVKLEIFNETGQRVRTIVHQKQSSGEYEILWNGRHQNGRQLPSGIYFYRLTMGGLQKTRKLVYIR